MNFDRQGQNLFHGPASLPQSHRSSYRRRGTSNVNSPLPCCHKVSEAILSLELVGLFVITYKMTL